MRYCGKKAEGRILRVAICVVAAQLLASLPARADSLSVFVGYADNLRASGFFPTPWLGAPNVVSQAPLGQTLDTGAIRIDNTGANPLVITNFQVTLNPSAAPLVFAIWNPLTILPGQVGIFTQTGSFNFDTSDHGVFGSLPPVNLEPNNAAGNGNTNLIGGCSSPASFMTPAQLTLCTANAPIISFNENGNLMSFTDTGHILDTGGWDFVFNSFFGEDGNESINWNTIGGSSRGGTTVPPTVPEPATLLLFGSGLAGLGGHIRLKRAAK